MNHLKRRLPLTIAESLVAVLIWELVLWLLGIDHVVGIRGHVGQIILIMGCFALSKSLLKPIQILQDYSGGRPNRIYMKR